MNYTKTERWYAYSRRMQMLVCEALAENIRSQRSGDGVPFQRLWADTAEFRGGKQSDRAGQPALIDTGALLGSLRPGAIVRAGNKLLCYIEGEGYGLDQHTGFSSPGPNVIGRTRAVREQVRATGEVPPGAKRSDFLVTKNDTTVPARPWISLSEGTVRTIAQRARG